MELVVDHDIHEISAVLMVIGITLQSQFALLAQKSTRKYSASRHECRWMFTENKAYTYLYSMARRPKRHRSDLQMCFWMEILSREKLHLLIYFVLFLTTLWMCYRTIKGILGSCESLCLLFTLLFNFWISSKNKFLNFFVGWFLLFWDRCGSFWDRPWSCEIVVDRCGIVVGRCGSLWVVPGFSNYGATCILKDQLLATCLLSFS